MRSASCACIAAAVAILAGCSTSSERMYYQTRYLPTDGADTVFAAHERARWTGDLEVYELPSHAPGLEDAEPRQNCLPPGARFKTPAIAGYRDEREGNSEATGGAIAAYDARPVPVSPLGPDYLLPISASHPDASPALVDRVMEPIGGMDGRPRSVTGAGMGTQDNGPMAEIRDADKWDYCLDPALPKQASAPIGGTAIKPARR